MYKGKGIMKGDTIRNLIKEVIKNGLLKKGLRIKILNLTLMTLQENLNFDQKSKVKIIR